MLFRSLVSTDDGSVITPRQDRLDEAELAQAPLEGVEFLLADPAGVGGIGVEWIDRNELDGDGR